MRVDWIVLYSRKAAKQREQLSNRWRKVLFALVAEIKKGGPVRLIVTYNSETFWLLSRRADEGLACVKPKRRNADSGQKGQN